jgi:septum formation protein
VKLVLASASPQRRDILASLGVAFAIRPTNVREDDEGPPRTVAQENALRKALACERDDDEIVLAVDTLVATETEIWGKPPNAEAARETLARLAGRTHEVVSGFAFVRGGDVRAGHEITRVTFRPLDAATLDWYVASGEWEGRAGGYAIQGRGAALVRRLEGDYLNVVGLPVAALISLWPDLMADAA